MDTEPGADERRIKALLKQRGVGPDAEPPPLPPGPPPAGFDPEPDDEDWWIDETVETPVGDEDHGERGRDPSGADGAKDLPALDADGGASGHDVLDHESLSWSGGGGRP